MKGKMVSGKGGRDESHGQWGRISIGMKQRLFSEM